MVVYDFFKDKIPKVIALKTRENEDYLIAESDGLDIFYLNETAKDFLELCDGERKIEEIKEIFLKDYVIDENSLEQDIVNLTRDLQWKNIIRLED
ncbi:PqqD family protein [uncultured Phascolarctobacterium sp.]|uniref:PqqD family protein n=1 Tax=uncultured Phascolarctobacterium sp. TaxID=512296 RepID=UPI0027DDBCCC|nr:PqqD family protein [uncultured Phascolarctobacterium sp.]